MFCHRNTGCCRHDGRCRRNIERIRAIPSGSNQINIMIGMRMNMLCFICQHRSQTSDFINRLSFHPQSGQKSSDLSLCSCTGQKKFHDFSCFFPGQILSVCYSLNCLFHIHNTNYSFFHNQLFIRFTRISYSNLMKIKHFYFNSVLKV